MQGCHKMNEEQSVEQRIGRYLEDNRITIVPVGTDTTEGLSFMQYRAQDLVEIGELVYDKTNNSFYPASSDEVRRRLEVPGFINNVVRPMAILFRNAQGDFYAESFEPIHNALDRIESQYGG